ncbi:Ivy family c-type lysozyme inhibitor [Zymobacter sp. IVIA_12111.31 C1]|uniref:Ivy family c-type lysozyme inhibitor n=1 Tax=Zymobacter sp. IVIA_12111.31 C1 TaxID=3394854 RepID=UPI0039C22223
MRPSLHATFCHTATHLLFAALGLLTMGQAMADEAQTYPDAYMKSHPQTQQAFQRATKPLLKQHKWVASYGTASPVGKYEQDGLIYTVITGCKPHECSSEQYIALVDIHSNVRGALIRERQRASGTLTTTTFDWFGDVDDSARTLILKAYSAAQ